MMSDRLLATLSLTTLLALGHAVDVQAQPKLEVGASLINAVVARESGESLTTVGIPSGGFGILNPGVYASIFLGTRMAVEPQLGLIWASANGDSFHILNFVTQFDYFFLGTQRRSPYVFATAGITDAGGDYSPKSFGAGLGYRIPMGERLTVRVDGRYARLTGESGVDTRDTVGFSVSIGGVFARN